MRTSARKGGYLPCKDVIDEVISGSFKARRAETIQPAICFQQVIGPQPFTRSARPANWTDRGSRFRTYTISDNKACILLNSSQFDSFVCDRFLSTGLGSLRGRGAPTARVRRNRKKVLTLALYPLSEGRGSLPPCKA